jgi:iron(III) transport system permease protein
VRTGSFAKSVIKNPWRYAPWVLAVAVTIPLLTIFSAFLVPEYQIWLHLSSTLLPQLLRNTVILMCGVGTFTILVGVSLGWCTGACDFPGRRFFSWALALPLALPAYVMAFIFLGIMDFAGPVQSLIRTLPGFGSFIVEVRKPSFIILVIGLTLYPYVYLLSRASFLNQSRSILEVSRTLGLNSRQTFFRVALPIARPWIVSGLALVLMETLADFGAVSIFNFDTFTTAIYKSWYGFFSLEAAAQLSSLLVIFALSLVYVEGLYRSKMRYHNSSRESALAARIQLKGWKAACATIYCSIIVVIAFVVPVMQLVLWSMKTIASGQAVGYVQYIVNTLVLGAAAGLLVCISAVMLTYSRRRDRSNLLGLLCRIATIGYALPGAVLAVGIVIPLTWMDTSLQKWITAISGIQTGPLLQNTILIVLGAYVVRFLVVGFGPIDSAMKNIKPSLDEAAASLGKTWAAILREVHLPLLRKGALTALVLTLVDVIKEMPITLMTRPFGWDTLAVKIFEFTSEGEWVRAAVPGLCLAFAGVIPVFLLISQMEKENG